MVDNCVFILVEWLVISKGMFDQLFFCCCLAWFEVVYRGLKFENDCGVFVQFVFSDCWVVGVIMFDYFSRSWCYIEGEVLQRLFFQLVVYVDISVLIIIYGYVKQFFKGGVFV